MTSQWKGPVYINRSSQWQIGNTGQEQRSLSFFPRPMTWRTALVGWEGGICRWLGQHHGRAHFLWKALLLIRAVTLTYSLIKEWVGPPWKQVKIDLNTCHRAVVADGHYIEYAYTYMLGSTLVSSYCRVRWASMLGEEYTILKKKWVILMILKW